MSALQAIEKGRQPKPPRLLIYGTEGVGKSTCAAGSPKPIFIQTEDGLDQIDCDRFPLAKRLDDVWQAIDAIAGEQHDYRTLVIDSADWLEQLIWDELCRRDNVKSIEQVAGGYAKGYTLALGVWRELIARLDAVRLNRKMAILLLAHSKVEKFEDPESSPYDRYSPRLHKHAAALVCEWCDAVLFATRKFRTQSEDSGFGRKRTTAQPIGRDGGDRVLRCIGGPTCIAKNRYAMPEEIPLSWSAIVEAIAAHSVSASPDEGAKHHG